ncbi:MAG: HEAT repeat domain-containing protein [Elusimicrobiota bacterium]
MPAAGSTKEDLLQLLDDSDQNVRVQTAKSLREYAASDRKVSDRLAAIMDDVDDNLFVRREAVKSLSTAASQSDDLRLRMIAAAQEKKNPDQVRAIACKALYSTLAAAPPAFDTRDALLALLADSNERPAVRGAAAWGLFPDALENPKTQEALLAAASDQWLEAGARVEAIRSLYFPLDQDRAAQETLQSLVKEVLTPLPARYAAVVVFHRVHAESAARDWLQDLSHNGKPDQIRTAAILAQTDGMTEELAKYFHVTRLDGRVLDTLGVEDNRVSTRVESFRRGGRDDGRLLLELRVLVLAVRVDRLELLDGGGVRVHGRRGERGGDRHLARRAPAAGTGEAAVRDGMNAVSGAEQEPQGDDSAQHILIVVHAFIVPRTWAGVKDDTSRRIWAFSADRDGNFFSARIADKNERLKVRP